MIKFGILLGVAIACVSAQSTCKCRFHDPAETCNSIERVSQTTCKLSSSPCSGCVCDLAGQMDCKVVSTNALVAIPGANSIRGCSIQSISSVLCPGTPTVTPQLTLAPPTPTPSPTPSPTNNDGSSSGSVALLTATAKCNLTSTNQLVDPPFNCELRCFQPDFGQLESVEARFSSNIAGSYQANTAASIGSVSVGQSVTHDGSKKPLGTASLDITFQPALSGATGRMQASTDIPFTLISDASTNYVCSAGQTMESFSLLAKFSTPSGLSITTFTGRHFMEFELRYKITVSNFSKIPEIVATFS
eukprot:CAMPEP_0184686256 /NCGR_PEP_ID=MMETSP0312-20130426/21806_1 /TAXON_ID=31354 /ORGANISM="Compsopogon coeruleus, Strain SAG 36.94" /LENGTH=302 /DNA_ID=CAMNT_0027141161 /DNA_START=2656 /DNA_END=3564 /DNA_ORIENTATION=+